MSKKPDRSEENIKFGLTEKQRSWIYTGLFFITFGVFFIVNNSGETPDQGPYPPNYKAKVDPSSRPEVPNFSLPKVDGSSFELADYEGKILIIDFWATWSAPCRNAIPELIELKKEYSDTDFEIIGISLDTDTKQNVEPFIEQIGINYPVVYGGMNITQEFGGIQSIPTSFVIDQKGRIYSRYVGYINKSIYKNDIEKLLGENR